MLTTQQNLNILGTVLNFANRVEPYGYAYKNSWLDEAVLTYNKKTDTMFGSFHIQGRDYEIEKCLNGHVLKQHKKAIMRDDVVNPDYEIPSNPALRFWGARDQTTIVTFTIKFYYTEAFARYTPDVESWIDNSIAVVNQAMINSLVPVRVKKFATEMAMIPEFRGHGHGNNLEELIRLNNDVTNSADFATILSIYQVKANGATGAAYVGGQFSSNHKDSMTILHELGHCFGGAHSFLNLNNDPEKGYAFGYQFDVGKNKFGTPLSYVQGRRQRLYYYSNPRIKHPTFGVPMGHKNANDMARKITEDRFSLNRGDESRTCYTCNAYSGEV